VTATWAIAIIVYLIGIITRARWVPRLPISLFLIAVLAVWPTGVFALSCSRCLCPNWKTGNHVCLDVGACSNRRNCRGWDNLVHRWYLLNLASGRSDDHRHVRVSALLRGADQSSLDFRSIGTRIICLIRVLFRLINRG
jgi:hypothetical protein